MKIQLTRERIHAPSLLTSQMLENTLGVQKGVYRLCLDISFKEKESTPLYNVVIYLVTMRSHAQCYGYACGCVNRLRIRNIFLRWT